MESKDPNQFLSLLDSCSHSTIANASRPLLGELVHAGPGKTKRANVQLLLVKAPDDADNRLKGAEDLQKAFLLHSPLPAFP